MSGGLRWRGHPLHPALVHFPLGLLLLVPAWDLLARAGLDPAPEIARWTQWVGLGLGAVAALPGFVDWLALRGDALRGPLADRHLLAAATALSLSAVAAAHRAHEPQAIDLQLGLDLLAAIGLAVTGRTGGELVYGRGVGVARQPVVEDGADPEAEPSARRESHL